MQVRILRKYVEAVGMTIFELRQAIESQMPWWVVLLPIAVLAMALVSKCILQRGKV